MWYVGASSSEDAMKSRQKVHSINSSNTDVKSSDSSVGLMLHPQKQLKTPCAASETHFSAAQKQWHSSQPFSSSFTNLNTGSCSVQPTRVSNVGVAAFSTVAVYGDTSFECSKRNFDVSSCLGNSVDNEDLKSDQSAFSLSRQQEHADNGYDERFSASKFDDECNLNSWSTCENTNQSSLSSSKDDPSFMKIQCDSDETTLEQNILNNTGQENAHPTGDEKSQLGHLRNIPGHSNSISEQHNHELSVTNSTSDSSSGLVTCPMPSSPTENCPSEQLSQLSSKTSPSICLDKKCTTQEEESIVKSTPLMGHGTITVSENTQLSEGLTTTAEASELGADETSELAAETKRLTPNKISHACRQSAEEFSRRRQLSFGDLPQEVLLKIVQFVPTVSLIVCSEVIDAFASLVSDPRFLDTHTRTVLGFALNQKDITYETVPAPVEPVQDLWFQAYLHQVAPYLEGVVRPGVVFYNLLCFRHLLDTWIMQGKGYKYWMFVADFIKSVPPLPLSLLQRKHLATISLRMQHLLTKLALCNPRLLLATLSDFEEFTISTMPPSELDDAWEHGIPSEWKSESLLETCELVSHQRSLSLAAFFLAFDRKQCFGWSGIIDYSTFRFKDTWGLCKASAQPNLQDCQQISEDLFTRFLAYTGLHTINVHCTNAFFLRSLNKLVLLRSTIMPQVQKQLEKTALSIHGKLKKSLPADLYLELKLFLDSVRFLGNSEDVDGPAAGAVDSSQKTTQREISKTTEVAVQRYLHR
jgi:hypothetical protein